MPILDNEVEALIVTTAVAHGLPPEIVRPVVLQESGGNTCAVRYEPGFFRRYLDGKPMNYVPRGCSVDTERVSRATSWGLMQVMGETARCNGFRGWCPELCQPEIGLEWGCRHLRRLADKYLSDGGWPTVLRAYNGGPGNRHNATSPYRTLFALAWRKVRICMRRPVCSQTVAYIAGLHSIIPLQDHVLSPGELRALLPAPWRLAPYTKEAD